MAGLLIAMGKAKPGMMKDKEEDESLDDSMADEEAMSAFFAAIKKGDVKAGLSAWRNLPCPSMASEEED